MNNNFFHCKSVTRTCEATYLMHGCGKWGVFPPGILDFSAGVLRSKNGPKTPSLARSRLDQQFRRQHFTSASESRIASAPT